MSVLRAISVFRAVLTRCGRCGKDHLGPMVQVAGRRAGIEAVWWVCCPCAQHQDAEPELQAAAAAVDVPVTGGELPAGNR